VPIRSYRRLLFKFWTLRYRALPPLRKGDLEATYIVHLRLIGKLVVDFLFVLIELFSLGATAEALRTNIDRKSTFLKGVGQFRPNFRLVGDVPREPFLHG